MMNRSSLELSVLKIVKAIALVLTGCMYVTRGNSLHYSPLVALGKQVRGKKARSVQFEQVHIPDKTQTNLSIYMYVLFLL